MRVLALLTGLLVSTSPLCAQEDLTIGVAAPLSGPSTILGRQLTDGAAAAAGSAAAILAADTECSAEGGEGAAREFVEAQVAALVGFLCTAAIDAALPILTAAGIPVIDVGVRANRLTDDREDTGHLVWRVAPRSDAEADALAGFVRNNWRDAPFGIVEDGSVHARDLTDEVRARLGSESIEPSLVDNYRPAEEVQFALARRIMQSGVTRLLAFGDRTDIAILARDAAEMDLDLEIVGGETLLDEPGEETPLASGIRAIAIDDTAGDFPAREDELVREGHYGPAFAATQIALEALGRSAEEETPFAEIMDATRFDTVLGPIGFDKKGDSDRDAFELLVWNGSRFVPAPQS